MATFRVKHLPNGRLQLIGERNNGQKFNSEHPANRRKDLDDELATLKNTILAEGESVIEYLAEQEETP